MDKAVSVSVLQPVSLHSSRLHLLEGDYTVYVYPVQDHQTRHIVMHYHHSWKIAAIHRCGAIEEIWLDCAWGRYLPFQVTLQLVIASSVALHRRGVLLGARWSDYSGGTLDCGGRCGKGKENLVILDATLNLT